MNPLLLGQLIWDGAIGALATSAEDYHGAGLRSHLGALVRQRYAGLNAGQQSTLAGLAFESIKAANAYLNGASNYTPNIGALPDPRALIQYAAGPAPNFLDGTVRNVKYSFVYRTRITDRQTGAVEYRENRIVLRSINPLSRDEMYRLASNEAQRQVIFNSGTDPRRSYALANVDVRGVEMSFGLPN